MLTVDGDCCSGVFATRTTVGNSDGCRFLYVVGQLRAGGLERQLFYLLQAMDRRRYNPAVFVWNYTESDVYVARIRALGVPVWSFAGLHGGSREKLREFRRVVRQVSPEVLHSYSFYTNLAAHWAAWASNTVPMGSVRSDFLGDKKESGPWLGRLSARWPRHQIFNSAHASRQAVRVGGLFIPKTMHVVRNGIDLEVFRYSPVQTPEPPLLLGIGTLIETKRWDRLIKLAARFKKEGHHFKLKIIGAGLLHGALYQLITDLQIEDHVVLPGQLDDVSAELRQATCLVHPSEVEGCPNVIMEAMASGRAVVAVDSGDVTALVEHGKTGYVVAPEDDAALARYVTLLLTNPDLSRKMGEAAREKANREFGVDRLVRETLAAYRAAGWKDK